MFRALPAVVFALFPAIAWAQQTPPIPDTRPARERHRLEDKNAPETFGPWGPEEAGFTWHAPAWRGLIVTVGNYSGASIGLDLPLGVGSQSDGLNPPIFERLKYHSESFRATSIGAVADFDTFRLSLNWFDGRFHATGTVSFDDGLNPVTSRDVDLDGNLYGFRFGVHWPAFRYRDSIFEASVGLIATVGWMHQETFVPGGTLLRRDTVDILTGSFGPKASLRFFPGGRFAIEADAEYSFNTGAARGWVREFVAGVGYSF
jgi:hypothetical protein